MEYQVAPALAEDMWSSSINVVPGQSIDVRVRVTYIGAANPIGLGSINFQPTVSNWISSSDHMTPVANGYGDSLPNDLPHGWVEDVAGQYGRIYGHARQGTLNASANIVGMPNLHGGVNYLRIAPAYVTDWRSGATPTGTGGVDTSQYSPAVRPLEAPIFDTRTEDIVLFKFNIILGASGAARDLVVDTPQELFGLYDSASGERQARWFADQDEVSGSIRGAIQTMPATIHVVPGPMSLTALAALLGLRRRRRSEGSG